MKAAVFRASLLSRIAIICLATMLVLLFFGIAALTLSTVFQGDAVIGLVLLVLTVILGALAQLLVNEATARTGWCIDIGADTTKFRLPASRSYLASPPAFNAVLTREDIRAVIWREEHYDTLGMRVTVRAWAMSLVDGRTILLGEDRPIGRTADYTHLTSDAGSALARWLGNTPHQKKSVVGDAGWLGVWFTRSPDW